MEKSFYVAVKGLLFKEGKLLIIRRSNYDGTGYGWELPGGGVQFGEEMEEALTRECKEEIGLPVTVGRILYADHFFPTESRQVVILTYLCEAKPMTSSSRTSTRIFSGSRWRKLAVF
jgi:8-oxo-dGTP diphosphatase